MSHDPVILALAQQVELYRRLAKLADVQRGYVQNGQTEELLDLLVRRQAVLDEVAGLEQAIAPAKRQWASYLAGLPAADRATADAHMAETRRLLERITSADRDDALVLQQRKLNLGRQIDQAQAARQVNRSYAAAAYGAPKAGLDVSSRS